jgi:hypothetical protein
MYFIKLANLPQASYIYFGEEPADMAIVEADTDIDAVPANQPSIQTERTLKQIPL